MSIIVRRSFRLLRTYMIMCGLWLRNVFSRSSIVGTGDVVVSLTSYGNRVLRCFYGIESIAFGSIRPRRLVLFLDDIGLVTNPPKSLKRLVRRGLEIQFSDNFGPHTKYYPYLLSTPVHNRPLVTSDDDVLYDRNWLSELIQTHREYPRNIVAQRAHFIQIGAMGYIRPYQEWTSCDGDTISSRNFATGVSGVLYPIGFLSILAAKGEAFIDFAPRADDVWLHAVAIRTGFMVKQVNRSPKHYPTIRGTQKTNLWNTNVFDGGNDKQIADTYSLSDVRIMAGG